MSAAFRPEPVRPAVLPDGLAALYAEFLRERFPKATPRRIDAAVAELSEAFTASRADLAGSYLNRPPVRSAYLAHFHPLQTLRAGVALSEVHARAAARGLWPRPTDTLRVADLGAGLGALSQALLALGPEATGAGALELVLVDHQRSALADARELTLRAAALLRPGAPAPRVRVADARLSDWLARARRERWSYDLVLAGAVLNEQHGDWEPLLAGVLEILAPGGVAVLVEPVLDEVVRKLMALREAALHATTTIAPCTHDGACPLLALRRDWCFTSRPARLPPDIARRARLLGHQTDSVHVALWAFAARDTLLPGVLGHGATSHGARARVVSDPMDGEHVLCSADGRTRTAAIAGAARGSLVSVSSA